VKTGSPASGPRHSSKCGDCDAIDLCVTLQKQRGRLEKLGSPSVDVEIFCQYDSGIQESQPR
jgi:hypothetical protein